LADIWRPPLAAGADSHPPAGRFPVALSRRSPDANRMMGFEPSGWLDRSSH